jgi:hypothetical protein
MLKSKHFHLFFFDKKPQNLSYSFDIPPIRKYFLLRTHFAQIKTCQSLSSLLGLLIVRTVDR